MNSTNWLSKQKKGIWLNVHDIPGSIFWTIWDNEIEKPGVKLHATESKFMIEC